MKTTKYDEENKSFLHETNRYKCWIEKAYHRGNSFVLRTNYPIFGMGPRWCIIGPHWPLMLFTYLTFLIFSIFSLYIITFNPLSNWYEILFGYFLSFLFLINYGLVACTDPGVLIPNSIMKNPTDSYCDYCESFRSFKTIHCSECKICILEYDHHCPWIGKCIGKNNIIYFYSWLFLLILTFVYNIIQITIYFLPPIKN